MKEFKVIDIDDTWEVVIDGSRDLQVGDVFVPLDAKQGWRVYNVHGEPAPVFGVRNSDFILTPDARSMIQNGAAKVYRKKVNILDHPAFVNWRMDDVNQRREIWLDGKRVASVYANRMAYLGQDLPPLTSVVVEIGPGKEEAFARMAEAWAEVLK